MAIVDTTVSSFCEEDVVSSNRTKFGLDPTWRAHLIQSVCRFIPLYPAQSEAPKQLQLSHHYPKLSSH